MCVRIRAVFLKLLSGIQREVQIWLGGVALICLYEIKKQTPKNYNLMSSVLCFADSSIGNLRSRVAAILQAQL